MSAVLVCIAASVPQSGAFNMDENDFLVSCGDDKPESIAALREHLEAGVDPEVKTPGGEAPLHLACIWDHAEKVSMLLAAGADPNVRSSYVRSSLDMTPLTWCVYGNRAASVRALVEDRRTNINLVVRKEDGAFITALDIAIGIGDETINEILVTAGAKTYNELQAMYDADVLQKLLPPDAPEEPHEDEF
jgi:ankyrin repeat protein